MRVGSNFAIHLTRPLHHCVRRANGQEYHDGANEGDAEENEQLAHFALVLDIIERDLSL